MLRIILRCLVFALPCLALGIWAARPHVADLGSAPPPAIPAAAPADTAVSSPPESALLDLNRASRADLEALPGIGPALAGRILEFRRAHGGFRHARELLLVRGIGPRKWERIQGRVGPR